MIKNLFFLVLIFGVHFYNTVTAESKDVVYQISIDGQPDLELSRGVEPCTTIQSHCLNFSAGSPLQYNSCFDTLHQRVSMQLGYHWSSIHEKLKINENLFIQCSKFEFDFAEQTNSTRPVAYIDKAAMLTTDYDLHHNITSSDHLIIQQLLDHIEALIKNNSFGGKEIALFDARTNKLKLSASHKFELFRQAILKFPTNLYIVNHFGLALMGLGLEEDARLLFQNGVARGLWDNPLQRPVFRYVRGLTSKPWHNKYDFFFVRKLEDGAKQIRNELFYNLENHAQLFMLDYENVPLCGDWKAIKLISNDGQRTEYADYFPKTMEVIDSSGQEFVTVKFSAIQPGSHISPHTGPSNDRLRVHLSLVHTGGARIRVGTEWRSWEEGKVIILDSSWEHEVIHSGNDTRIVLILDIWHPELSFNDKIL